MSVRCCSPRPLNGPVKGRQTRHPNSRLSTGCGRRHRPLNGSRAGRGAVVCAKAELAPAIREERAYSPMRLRTGRAGTCGRAGLGPEEEFGEFGHSIRHSGHSRPSRPSPMTSCAARTVTDLQGFLPMARPGLEPGTPRFSAAGPPRANVVRFQPQREAPLRACVPILSRAFRAITEYSGAGSRTCA